MTQLLQKRVFFCVIYRQIWKMWSSMFLGKITEVRVAIPVMLKKHIIPYFRKNLEILQNYTVFWCNFMEKVFFWRKKELTEVGGKKREKKRKSSWIFRVIL